MLEVGDWALVVVFCGFFSALFAVIGGVIVGLWYDSKLKSAVHTVYGDRGLQARADKKARMAEVFTRAAELRAEKKPVGEILQSLAFEYPDVALEIPGYLQKMTKKLGLEGVVEDL